MSLPSVHTAEELERLNLPNKRTELVRGQLIVREPAGFRHGDVAMALRSDGRPVIAVGNSFSQLLVICGDAACTPGSRVIRTLDNGSIGTFSLVALRADDTPLVAYFEFGSGQTRLYVCAEPTCASGAIRTITPGPSAMTSPAAS